MDFKLLFLGVTSIAVLYNVEVDISDDKFSAIAARNINVDSRNLFEFVTTTHWVDRWLDWIPVFVAGDAKLLDVGKIYKIYSGNEAILFKVTDFNDGNYIAIESNFLLRPRVEVRFEEMNVHENVDKKYSPQMLDSMDRTLSMRNTQLQIRLTFKRASAFFQYTLGALIRLEFQEQFTRSLRILDKIVTNSDPDIPDLFDCNK